MIKQLKIKNFALVKNLEINFSSGFNVLIGETGAGKSIILKSIMFLLGEKANKDSIRTGENVIKVEGVFDNCSNNTLLVLKDLGIENDSILLLSRTFDANGKNEYRINGSIVALSMLKQVAETLVDTYGQHENQLLLKTANHINILDSCKPEILQTNKQNIVVLLQEYKQVQANLTKLGGSFENRERMLDLLDYQIKEIENAKLLPNEDEEIENKLNQIRNFEKINTALQTTYSNLAGNNCANENIKNAIKTLTSVSKYDNQFESIIERLNSSLYELQDISELLNDIKNNNDFSEYELEKLDERLDKIKILKKKYGNDIALVLTFLENAKAEREKLFNAEKQIEISNKKLEELTQKLNKECFELSNKRKSIALEIENKIAKEFAFLGMKNAKLKVNFKDQTTFSNNGFDNVEFLFSANVGQDLKVLTKTISGGEMSRFMLALKSILTENYGIGTLVFDEIDSGISGEIGSAIAERIAKLAKTYQVLCITHLPQVSAMADNYFYVSKQTENNTTSTKVEKLEGQNILISIAKLSGGEFNTDVSLAHAKELKNWAEKFKKTF